MMNRDVKGIYLHIPFCHNICFYCDFCKVYYDEKLADLYLEQLEKEFNEYEIETDVIETIYIGGGTPSSLSYKQLEKLLEIIAVERFTNLMEFTIEVNPESMNKDKIILFLEHDINRISIGVQTFNDDILKSLNRCHTKDMVLELISGLRESGLTNISLDLMYGFEDQTISDIKKDLEIIKALNIKHLAIYSLIIEAGTVFNNTNYQINELEYEMSEYLDSYLVEELGFEHYEVSNYAKEANYSKHNLLYWNNEKYYGIGLGASGYLANCRYDNTKSITNYLKSEYNRQYNYYENDLELLKDEIMLQFRKYNGIDLKKINEKYLIDFTKFFKSAIITNINNIDIKDGKLYFTKHGKNFLNDVIIDFLECIEEE